MDLLQLILSPEVVSMEYIWY